MYDESTEILEIHDEEILHERYHSEYEGMESEVTADEETKTGESENSSLEEQPVASVKEDSESYNVVNDRLDKILEALALNDDVSFEAEILIAHMEIQREQNDQLIKLGVMNVIALGLIFGALLVKSLMEWFKS
jgi:hypothetical protein